MPLRIVPDQIASRSLQQRLWWAAGSLITAGLLLAALGLNALFRNHVEVDMARRMQGHLDDLLGALVVEAPTTTDGNTAATASGNGDDNVSMVRLAREPADPLFRRPGGGLYWVVWLPDGTQLRSRSWWDTEPGFAPPGPDGFTAGRDLRTEQTGPSGEPLLMWLRLVQVPGLDEPVVLGAGGDAGHLAQASASFGRSLALSVTLLGALLLLAMTLQVRLGLVPLRHLQSALAGLRRGERQRLDGTFPAEVQPLVDDLNRVLDDNEALVARAQAQAGNLAHALKTPLSVLNNLAHDGQPCPPELLRNELARMQRQIDLHLMRARASASAHQGRSRSALDALMPPLIRTLQSLYPRVKLSLKEHPQAQVRMEAIDLQEVVGNLLDNACKWTHTRVALGWDIKDGAVLLQVDDDGPGIPPDARAAAQQRGTRLDEREPGSGLGLAIVVELLALYGGELTLTESPWKGLRAQVRLPLATQLATS